MANTNKQRKQREDKYVAVKKAYDGLIQGKKRSVIVEDLQKRFGYAPTTAKDIYTNAKSLLAKDFDEERKYVQAKVYGVVMDLLEESRAKGDIGSALKCLDMACKITGAYTPQQILAKVETISVDFGFNSGVDTDVEIINGEVVGEITEEDETNV